MKEIEVLSENDKKELLRFVEEQCAVVLPDDQTRLGSVTFHLYRYQRQEGLYFLIRWGLQKIFGARGIRDAGAKHVKAQLRRLIRGNAAAIKKALSDYYAEQLNNLAQIDLQTELMRYCSDADQLNLRVCQARNCRTENPTNYGWPNFCVVISWLDETDEFQEFLFPLPLNAQSKSFTIPTEEIITRFRRYRDELV